MSKDKLPLVALYRNLAGLLMREPLNAIADNVSEFPRKFLVTTNGVLLESDSNNVVKIVTKLHVMQAITKFVDQYPAALMDYHWTAKQARDFIDYYVMLAPTLPLPQSWAWKSDTRYAFHKLPWDPSENGPTPFWDNILERMSNAPAFKSWVGSLFDPESDRQQYVWMHGGGQNSKGTMLRFLDRVFGEAFSARVVPQRGDKFWTHGLVGRRLVAFPDTNDAGWPASGLFKSLTGDDPVEVEKKGEMPFTARLECKFIFASQEKPTLSSEFADMRRVILCEVGKVDGDPDPRYGDRLWDEGGAFLSKCIAEYKDRCPQKGRIKSDTDELVDWIEDVEAHFAALLDEHFEAPKDCREADMLSPNHLALWLARYLKTDRERRDFRKYLKRRGIEKKVVRVGDEVRKIYAPIRMKAPWLM